MAYAEKISITQLKRKSSCFHWMEIHLKIEPGSLEMSESLPKAMKSQNAAVQHSKNVPIRHTSGL